MLYRVEVGLHSHLEDTVGKKTATHIAKALHIDVGSVRIVKVFTVEGLEDKDVTFLVKEAVWHDPVMQCASLTPLLTSSEKNGQVSPGDFILEIGFRPGVTDNEGRTARDTAAMVLQRERNTIAVYTSVQYHFTHPHKSLTTKQVEHVARDLLCNELIQRYRMKNREEWLTEPGFTAQAARVTGAASDTVDIFALSSMDDTALQNLSRTHTLALSLEEMQTIRDYFQNPEVQAMRAHFKLPADPTDAELEVLAQTWSEHCKHKIFASRIDYENTVTGMREDVDNLYKSCIRDATALIRQRMGENDFCKSVFKDNAGVVAFIGAYDACIKVETHNSPSALDPYGGALTGIVGVNRDPMGTGMGAELVCNTNVFCFASPFHDTALPPRLLHPRRVLEGVREGVEHGGNKSGVPTVNGSLVFDQRYLGKPLVYCGTVGIMPTTVAGKHGWEKKAQVGDCIVMVGGRIGKDGIHGATFSSEELHEGSPATAVQIGDPITQRKMYDCIIQARDKGLYNAITDNGAGGLSSSVGEMAEDTGGCTLDLAKAPLKYDGLRPWETLISEAQERMTLAVPPEKLDTFLALAKDMDVEATALGHFTDSGYFHITYGDKIVSHLSMDFMHEGVPQLQLKATWQPPQHTDSRVHVQDADTGTFLKTMLGRLNICSKEYIVRQYDHEVRGGSAIKPLVGVKRDGPSDAGVIRPVLESDAGLVIAHGICPKFSDYDTYWMMANAMDEAIRNAVAVGGNPDRLAGVDNFCWCDPVQSEKTPDGHYKLAQLVRACKALSHFSLAYGIPCISGKDSMKNDYTGGGAKISIPPTVLFSVLGVIDNVTRTQTSDFKKAGEYIYILGGTRREMAGSEAAQQLGLTCNTLPTVDVVTALPRYRALHRAIYERTVSACHDLSDGGLAVALAEMCIGGRLGAHIDLAKVPALEEMNSTELLYSESASRLLVSVPANKASLFEARMHHTLYARIGSVSDDSVLTISHGQNILCAEPVEALAKAFKVTLDW